MHNEREQAVLQMLAAARLSDVEAAERATNAIDPEFWERLAPGLSVERHEDPAFMVDALPGDFDHDVVVRQYRREGWIRTPRLLRPEVADRMRSAIGTLRREGWPEVFAFAYDEFWLAPRVPALSEIITDVLGPGYKQLPHVWGHYVAPGSSGWSPHTDGSGTERLTVWFALSDATIENSCMYVIPAHRTPPSIAGRFPETESVARRDLYALLQHARALPTPAGAALSWHHHVIHWGAPSYETTVPRISFSQEFISSSATPARAELPLIDAVGPPLPLRERLHFVATAVLSYQHYEPLMTRFAPLAERLVL